MRNWLRVSVDGREEEVPLVAVTDTVLQMWYASGARIACLCTPHGISLHIRRTKSGYALITNSLRISDHDPRCTVGGRHRVSHSMATPQPSSAPRRRPIYPACRASRVNKQAAI